MIFEPSQPQPPRLEALKDIAVQAPQRLAEEARFFYATLLGLPEIEPSDQPTRNRIAFAAQDYRIVVDIVDGAVTPDVQRRAVLVVRSLREVEARLAEHDVTYVVERRLSITGRRLLVEDPAGHRYEIRQTWSL